MAKQGNNIIMRNTRGMVGKQIVFKRRAGRSYVAAPPEVNENRKATPKQLAVQQRFKTSIAYAKAALTSIELKEAYDKVALRGQSAFNVAFKDAFNAPEIVGIVAEGYQGVAGNVIVVHAKDDFRVNAVKVSIRNSADELIEEGAASANADGLSWSYVVQLPNPDVTGTKIKATAFDIPENEGSLEVTL